MSDEAAAQFAVNSITAVGLVDNAAVPQVLVRVPGVVLF